MLIEDYLPVYDFKESHSIRVNTSSNDIYQKMLHADFSKSTIINFLFRIRGIPKGLYTIEHITKMGFIKLDEEPGKEILFGMITNSPVFNKCQSNISPSDFSLKSGEARIKAVINFKVNDQGFSNYVISTETRILCGSKQMKLKFRVYWFFVKPFSQLIRKSMLKQIIKQL